MRPVSPVPPTGELVPLAERARSLQVVRATLVVLVVVLDAVAAITGDATAPDAVRDALWPVVPVGLAYLVLAAALGAAVALPSRSLALSGLGGALLLDGVFLGWVGASPGGAGTAVAGLVALHAVAVTLLSSFRTGLKVALWHSIVALVLLRAQQSGLLVVPGAAGVATTRDLVHLVVVLWATALVTATAAAVNERELRRRRTDAEDLRDLGLRMHRAVDLGQVDAALADFALDTLGARRVAVVRPGPDGLLRARGHGVTAHAGAGTASLLAQASRHGRRLVTHVDARRDPWLAGLLPGARYLLVLPVSAVDEAGHLVVENEVSRRGRVRTRVLDTARQALVQAALTAERVALQEQLADAARRDGLTGLANRRTFDVELAAAVAAAEASGGACSLFMVDLDHFKRINDEHGHQTGDDVLRAVGGVLARLAGDLGIPARYGGEEFAVLLPGVGAPDAAATAELVRSTLEALELVVPVTASIGLASVPVQAQDAAGLVAAADAALYVAKAGGRNRVVVAPAPAVADAVVGLLPTQAAPRESTGPAAAVTS